MVNAASSHPLAQQARQAYLDALLRDGPGALQAVLDSGRALAAQTPDPALHSKRRDAVTDLARKLAIWDDALRKHLRDTGSSRIPATGSGALRSVGGKNAALDLALVDDATIENGILGSRLAQTINDRTSWQFSDLRARLSSLEKFEDLPPHDMLAAQTLADAALKSWLEVGLDADTWRTLQNGIHDEFALLAEAAYHDANRWLLDRGVCPDIDLRPFIRLSRSSRDIPAGSAVGAPGTAGPGAALRAAGAAGSGAGRGAGGGGSAPARSPSAQQADVVLSQLSQLMSKHLSDYGGLPHVGNQRPASSTLQRRSAAPKRVCKASSRAAKPRAAM